MTDIYCKNYNNFHHSCDQKDGTFYTSSCRRGVQGILEQISGLHITLENLSERETSMQNMPQFVLGWIYWTIQSFPKCLHQ